MTTKDSKKYANESTIHTVKILEALEGLNFEPVRIKKIIERIQLPPGVKMPEPDKVRRVLLTLELLGWAEQNEKKEWTLGGKVLRLANRYGELCAAALNKN